MKKIGLFNGFVITFSALLLTGITYAQKDGTSSTGKSDSNLTGTSDGRGQMPGQQMNQPHSLFEKQALDMTSGQAGVAGKYDVVPVPRGELVDEKGGPLDQIVKNKKGETIGTIEKLLKDTKTGKVEYAVLELEGDKFQLPIQWSQFKQEGDHLTLNATQKELRPTTNSTLSKDRSPEVSQYMNEINKVRDEPKPKGGNAGGDAVGTGRPVPNSSDPDRPAATGPMGESSVGGQGPSGTHALPPGQAPGYEGGRPDSKR